MYTVPEAATTLFHGGVAWDEMSEQQQYVFQKAIVKTMMTFEETFVQVRLYSILALFLHPSLVYYYILLKPCY